MKRYRVKINGKTYNVELESLEETNEKIVEEIIDKKEENCNGEKIDANDVLSPIQGTIIDVIVKEGQKVKKGDILLMIEAMKLENEVNSPFDGEIVEVYVEKGQSVASEQLLVRIK